MLNSSLPGGGQQASCQVDGVCMTKAEKSDEENGEEEEEEEKRRISRKRNGTRDCLLSVVWQSRNLELAQLEVFESKISDDLRRNHYVILFLPRISLSIFWATSPFLPSLWRYFHSKIH